MLLLEDSRGEGLNRIAFNHRYGALQDERPTIECLINKVNRAAAQCRTMLQRLSLRVETREGRQQTRMNIEYPPSKHFDEARRQQSHVSRETNQIYAVLA